MGTQLAIRYSKRDFILRLIGILLLLCGIILISINVKWNVVSHVGAALASCGMLVVTFLYYRHVVMDSLQNELDSPVRVLETNAKLVLIDSRGAVAEYHKEQLCEARQEIRGFREMYLYADGTIDGVRTGENEFHRERVLNDKTIAIDFQFKQPPHRGERFSRDLWCVYRDSFVNPKEYYSLYFTFPCKQHSLIIVFPKDRPVKRAWLTREYRGVKESGEITDPELIRVVHEGADPSVSKIVSRCFGAEQGLRQIVHWEW